LERLCQRVNRENRLRLQLWEELGKDYAMDRYCIYSGQRLSKAMLFGDEIEIDHILPFSRSLHDGIGNKILCTRQSNRDKGNRTPFEAWGHTARWAEIEARAERLPEHKRKLFRDNALESFLDGKDFLARYLTVTAYLGRAAKQYLTYVCHKDEVWVSTGKLTGMIRGKYGLSKLLSEDGAKNRDDHRHHALDAAVIGLCSRSLIQRMANAAEAAERDGENRLLERLELPWPSYRDELKACLDAIVVSHKPDRGVQSAMHKAGNYGLRASTDNEAECLYCSHVPIENLGYGNVAPQTGKRGRPSPKVRDLALRERLMRLLEGKSDREAKQALLEFSRATGIRRVQLQQNLGTAIPITRKHTSEAYRYVLPDENYCRDIVRKTDGKWESLLVNSFEANRSGFRPDAAISADGRSIVMRLRKGDMLAIEEDGCARRIMRIAMFTNEGVALAEHMESNTSERDAKHIDGFSYRRVLPEPLRKLKARLVGVDILGYVNDPGFRE
jgi:CRISPR-associated endonuclease Csn1